MRISFSPEARRDRLETRRYYFDASPRVAEAFTQQLRAAVDFLVQFPLGGPELFRGYRRKQVMGFPYSVIYHVDDDVVRVVAIAHHKRGERFLRDRLR